MTQKKPNYVCIKEEQVNKHSEDIAELKARAEYKHFRVDELNEKIDKITDKIDHIVIDINDIKLQSQSDDTKLDKRLTSIETRLNTQEKMTKDARDDTNLKIAIIGAVLGILTVYFNYLQ